VPAFAVEREDFCNLWRSQFSARGIRKQIGDITEKKQVVQTTLVEFWFLLEILSISLPISSECLLVNMD
jgi:hypothetical protein